MSQIKKKKNNDLLPANVDIHDYAISPNGNRIVIQAGSAQNPPSLFSVDSTGLKEIVVLTTQSLSGSSTLSDFNISPNSEFVIYLSEQETVNQEELLW